MLGNVTPFIDRTYEEAKALLVEARDYMQYGDQADRAGMAPLDSLKMIGEGLRLTTRLTEVMAWSLTQKAVQAGEISRDQAVEPRRRLGGQEICLGTLEFDEHALPDRLGRLLARSLSLYQRVQRLDRLVAGEEMQFGSFHICLAASEQHAVAERRDQRGVTQFLLA
jgi:regulator of CtrA degradation